MCTLCAYTVLCSVGVHIVHTLHYTTLHTPTLHTPTLHHTTPVMCPEQTGLGPQMYYGALTMYVTLIKGAWATFLCNPASWTNCEM